MPLPAARAVADVHVTSSSEAAANSIDDRSLVFMSHSLTQPNHSVWPKTVGQRAAPQNLTRTPGPETARRNIIIARCGISKQNGQRDFTRRILIKNVVDPDKEMHFARAHILDLPIR